MDIINQQCDGEICIIPQLETHAEKMYQVLANSELYAFTDDKPPASVSWLARRYARLTSRTSPDGTQLWLNWVVQSNNDHGLVGYVQATVDLSKSDIAWVIGVSCQGKGYATKAATLMMIELKRLGVRTFTCHIKQCHQTSNRVAEKLGFHPTSIIEDREVVWCKSDKK